VCKSESFKKGLCDRDSIRMWFFDDSGNGDDRMHGNPSSNACEAKA